ncbi:MAG: hypothetical protein ACRECT_00095 [Thermoplasmata archaeon]
MSENGPREGTRDLPRAGHETGRRAVEEDSPAGLAYGTLSRSLRRRRADLVALMEGGESSAGAAQAYDAAHPLEPRVSDEEIDTALSEVRPGSTRKTSSYARRGRAPPRPG